MQKTDRRGFLKANGALLATGLIVSLRPAYAEEKSGHMDHGGSLKSEKGADAFVVKAHEKGICATCQYWGGIRRVSEDKATVYCESLGWCNNPKSPHYQSKTTPVTGPMDTWKKWDALTVA